MIAWMLRRLLRPFGASGVEPVPSPVPDLQLFRATETAGIRQATETAGIYRAEETAGVRRG
jgi:pyruvate-formate lyase-activating enzyme